MCVSYMILNSKAISTTAPAAAESRQPKDRRRRTTPMISSYLFIGSRRANRRLSDPQTNYYVDRPGKKLLISALLIILLGVFDVIFTYKLLIAGGSELNPLISFCLSLGWGYCISFKLMLTIVGLSILLLHQNFFRMQRIMGSVGAFYISLFSYQIFLLSQI